MLTFFLPRFAMLFFVFHLYALTAVIIPELDEIDGVDGRGAIDALIQIIKAPIKSGQKGAQNIISALHLQILLTYIYLQCFAMTSNLTIINSRSNQL